MRKTLLVTRPGHDNLTTYLYYWCEPPIKLAKEKNLTVVDLSDKNAEKKLFESYLNKLHPEIIFLNGHGNEETVTGHDNNPLLQYNDNDHMVKNSILYVLSCSAAQTLGKSCVLKKAAAFVGYKASYYLYTDDTFSTHPLNDTTAQLFLEPSNLVITTIIKGNTVWEAYSRSREALIRNIKYTLSSIATKDQRDLTTSLYTNLSNFVVYGFPDARI